MTVLFLQWKSHTRKDRLYIETGPGSWRTSTHITADNFNILETPSVFATE